MSITISFIKTHILFSTSVRIVRRLRRVMRTSLVPREPRLPNQPKRQKLRMVLLQELVRSAWQKPKSLHVEVQVRRERRRFSGLRSLITTKTASFTCSYYSALCHIYVISILWSSMLGCVCM